MLRRLLLILAGLGLLTFPGCTGEEDQGARSEPWLKDEVALSRSEQSEVRFRAAPGQALAFAVKSKQGSVAGRVPLESAELALDPRALDLAQARLTFDLDHLSVGWDDGPAEAHGEREEGAAPAGDLLLTEAARLWLRLGSDVPASQRAQAEVATFTVRLGRALSSHSIQGGSVVSPSRSGSAARGSVRRVRGTVEGELLLLGHEVTHALDAEVDFLLTPGPVSKASLERVIVRLSEAEAVPFSEHRIQPRDARGAVVSEQLLAMGRSANLRALVTGALVFESQR